LLSPILPAKFHQRGNCGNVLREFVKIVDGLSLAGAACAAFALAAIAVIMLFEIVTRSFFGATLRFSWEYASYLMAALFFLGAAYTLRSGAHIRMGVLIEHVTPRIAITLDMFCTLIAIAVMAFVTYALADFAWQAHLRGAHSFTPMHTYLAIPQASPAIGAAMIVLQLLARLATHVAGIERETPEADDALMADR
jgi:C4-dicarboxylate transporter, DctQ subunit